MAGGLIAAAGLAWLAQLPTHSGYSLHVLAPTLVVAAASVATALISLFLKGPRLGDRGRPPRRGTAPPSR
jgi:hypothetical protein